MTIAQGLLLAAAILALILVCIRAVRRRNNRQGQDGQGEIITFVDGQPSNPALYKRWVEEEDLELWGPPVPGDEEETRL